MNVIVTIEGREAIPVRAIPLLTNWEEMSPDVVARALAGDDVWFPEFSDLQSYRIEDGSIKPIRPSYWANFTCREIEALDEQIKLVEPSHEVGYQQWRSKSLPTLPAGAFVWRNEFEKCFFMKYGDDGEDLWSERYGWVKRNPGIELDYDPFIPDADVRQTVMEGFDSIPELVPCLPGTSVPPHAPPQSASRQLRIVQMLAIQSSQEYQHMTQEVEAAVLEGQADADGERKNIQRLGEDDPLSATQSEQTAPATAAPAPVQGVEEMRDGTATRKTKRDLLAPVIEVAQKECGSQGDAPAIWAVMLTMAKDSNRKLPLLGMDEDAIKWQDSGDNVRMFTIKNLRDRLSRAQKNAE